MIAVNPDGFGLATRNGATCSICGSGRTDPNTFLARECVSLGVYIEMEGWVDICMNCAREIGGNAGMVDRSDYDLLILDYERLSHELVEQVAALAVKDNAVAVLSGELAGAAKRKAAKVKATVVEQEPDFAESQAEREQTYSVDS